MQGIFTACTRPGQSRILSSSVRRYLSTPSSPPSSASSLPWFVDPAEVVSKPSSQTRQIPPHRKSLVSEPVVPLPSSISPHSPIASLHATLATSPYLEPGTLLVREPVLAPIGPPLPPSAPKGRRKRGGTYFGEGFPDSVSGLWSWIVIAQVKDGTENRGAIESVLRVVRKSLLNAQPPLPLPQKNRRRTNDGWAMVDAGDFAVHIVSGAAREKYFPDKRDW